MTTGSLSQWRKDNSWNTGVSGGTTLDMIMSAISENWYPAWRIRSLNTIAYSSVVFCRAVETTQWCFMVALLYRPNLMLVLLISTASNIQLSSFLSYRTNSCTEAT